MPDILRFDDSRATRIASRLKRDATGNLLLSGTVHILGFHSRDETAMLVYKTMAKWQVLHNNRIKFPKDLFRCFSVHQHGRRDVT